MPKRGTQQSQPQANYIWQDREIRFDVPLSQLKPRQGEVEIDSINSVEDTQGNNGEKGQLCVTNLRLIWLSHRDMKTNLSIGFSCISNTEIKQAASRQRGNIQGLYVMTKYKNSRFRFIFTSLVKNSPRLFTTVQVVFRSYESTKLYRDLKLRGAIIKDKQLIELPSEEVYNKVDGVWNLSSDQGNLGTFFVTNVRLVWHANLAENFNVSIPYLQIDAIKIRDSKFGHALVVETSKSSGGYILGFRMDPHARLLEVYQEIKTLHDVFSKNPVFGIEYKLQEKPQPLAAMTVKATADIVEQYDDSHHDPLAAYYADGDQNLDREPVFNEDLGLAVEKLREGISVADLWDVR